ncbi:MAG: Gfo/Idh/MocA family oxidoreductase [Clostridia bacterium]|nr:Gfo/Idh/MocA family oxidoreductase [Clostridia bacterium]
MGIRIGIVGFGEFSGSFMDHFQTHPDVDEVVGAEVLPERREEFRRKYGLEKIYDSYEQMLECEDKLDAVGIFTQRHQHGPMVITALKRGLHVFSAVPLSCEVDEAFKIIELVKKTRKIYMAGETCYYFPCAIWCREKYKTGAFGKFVYGESQYYHDITEMFGSFASGGSEWKKVAGIPPMYYSTHSMSMLFLSIGEYPVEVTCMGFEDDIGDGIYGKGNNLWDNPFSNETAIFKMSGGGVARINEFRRCGTNKPSSYITSLIGTHASYMCNGMHHTFTVGNVFGQKPRVEYISNEINSHIYTENKDKLDLNVDPIMYKCHRGFSKVHDISRLPVSFRDIPDGGHNGSHPFLVDDFVRACVTGKLPPNNVWDAATCMIPGVIAHDSAMQGGKTLPVPFVGKAPADWDRIDYSDRIYE